MGTLRSLSNSLYRKFVSVPADCFVVLMEKLWVLQLNFASLSEIGSRFSQWSRCKVSSVKMPLGSCTLIQSFFMA